MTGHPSPRPVPTPRTDPFRSSRLIFRAIEPSSPEDDALLLRIQQSTISFQNFSCSLPLPRNSASASAYRRDELESNRLLAVLICLPHGATPAPASASAPASPPPPSPITSRTTPVGLLTMTRPDPTRHHHRRAVMGVFVLDEYQRKGYGAEAIRWGLQWGFEMAGLHRVGIECVDWAEGLLRLYKRIGFREEGRAREFYWFEGRWWDYHQLAMLEDEWRGMREGVGEGWRAEG